MVARTRRTNAGCKRYSPPRPSMTWPLSSARMLQLMQMACGRLGSLHQGITPSMTRTLPADTLLPNKSQPFSIVWVDNTDSICDLQCLLTYVDNYVNKRHNKADATRSSTTNGSACRTSNGAAAPSSLPSPSSLPQPPLPPHNPPAPAFAAAISDR